MYIYVQVWVVDDGHIESYDGYFEDYRCAFRLQVPPYVLFCSGALWTHLLTDT